MIYFPARASEATLRARAAAVDVAPWEDDTGQLIGWKSVPPAGAAGTPQRLVVFHGNAGQALDRTYFRDGFAAARPRGAWSVHVFEYPGYGARAGTPGAARFVRAGAAALETLWRSDPRALYLLGESIGSGVACALAARFPDRIAGLLLITPFTRLADVAAHHYPFLPVRLLLRERYDNLAALEHYHGAVGIVLAGRDAIIPPALGQRLYARYDGPKRLWVHASAGHNSMDYRPQAPWWSQASAFLLQAEPDAARP